MEGVGAVGEGLFEMTVDAEHSGYGKDLSSYSLEDCTRVKHVMTYLGS
ncbi:hypothetical protein ACIQVC_25905 [Streptomyces sp. NPDC101112]